MSAEEKEETLYSVQCMVAVLTRDLVRSLVAIVWESDPSTLLPTSLQCDGEDLLSHAGGLAVIIQHLVER